MPSPFPGMDPWLEDPALFPDLHAAMTFLMREALNAVMPAGYTALGNYLVWRDDTSPRVPDVSVLGGKGTTNPDQPTGSLTGLLALGADPVSEPRRQPYLEIRTQGGERLVTVIELLSPSNKVRGGRGRKAYLRKQREFREAGVNLVEVDLLRSGAPTTAVAPERLRQVAGAYDYHVSVVVAGPVDQLYAAPIRLSDRLPVVGIPLDPTDGAVNLDLQPLLDRAYDSGRYDRLVRYERPPVPPLDPPLAAWAATILAQRPATESS